MKECPDFVEFLSDSYEQSGFFLRFHLLMEQGINCILKIHARHPESLNLDRMTVSSKINQCEVFGFMREDLVRSLKIVNRERNCIAHNFRARADFKSLTTVISKLPAPMVKAIRAVLEQNPILSNPTKLEKMFESQINSHKAGQKPTSENLDKVMNGYEFGATTRALVLVFCMSLGYEISTAKYSKENRDKLASFGLACALEEEQGNKPNKEKIAKSLGLPPEPNVKDSLDSFFREINS